MLIKLSGGLLVNLQELSQEEGIVFLTLCYFCCLLFKGFPFMLGMSMKRLLSELYCCCILADWVQANEAGVEQEAAEVAERKHSLAFIAITVPSCSGSL